MEDPVKPPKGFVAGNERLDRMLAKYPGRRWGVRMPDGELHYGLSQGDAENLEAITGGQLVAWVNDGWEDVSWLDVSDDSD